MAASAAKDASTQMVLGRLLPHIPRLLNYALAAPAVGFGFVITLLFFVFYVGRSHFRDDYAPIAGFQICSLLLAKVLLSELQSGFADLSSWRRRRAGIRSISEEIRLMDEGRLD
jgi:hypothetical protein